MLMVQYEMEEACETEQRQDEGVGEVRSAWRLLYLRYSILSRTFSQVAECVVLTYPSDKPH